MGKKRDRASPKEHRLGSWVRQPRKPKREDISMNPVW